MSEVADALCVSPRTLHRRLAAEGVGFSELQAEALRRDALRLLVDRRLSIADVAKRLGYEEPGNFTRAFKHLTGVNPAS